MKKILEFFKNLIVCILILLSVFTFHCFMALNSASTLISRNNIVNTIKAIEIEEFLGESSGDNIHSELEEMGIHEEYVSNIINNEQIKEIVGGYVADILEAVVEGKDIPKFKEKELSKSLKEVYDIVVKETGNKVTKEEKELVYKAIDENISDLVNIINESQDEIKEAFKNNENSLMTEDEKRAYNFIKNVQNIYNNRIYFLYATIGIWILIAILNMKKFRFIKSLERIYFAYAIQFLCIGIAIPLLNNKVLTNSTSSVKNIISVSINNIAMNYIVGGVIFIVVAIILLILYPIIMKKMENKEITNNMEENNIIS